MNPTSRRPALLTLGFLGTVLVLLLAAFRPATASPRPPQDPGTGALIGRDADGRTVDFPLKHTDVRIEVSGFLAQAEVTQQFTNPYDRRIEAVYVFPLPENAAVDDMTLVVGDRTIRGVIRERGEARQIYEQARASGRTAALLEQERPNIFTQSVANLLPGDDVKITIRYVQTLKYEAGTLSLAFPMVVGPRYIPGHVTTPEGDAFPVNESATCTPDADRITPPVLRPGTRSSHDVSLAVTLDSGVPYTNLRSRTHAIDERRSGPASAEVRLAGGDAIPNQDFVLEWDVRPERVEAGLLAHREGGDGFFTLMLVPAPTPRPADVTPKEMVFVLDCSGSMSGAPIEASKDLVRHALTHMNPGDTFRIMSFSMSASGLSPKALPNTPANIQRGLAYLDTLHGEGGTEMLSGIRAALDGNRDPNRLRVVLFLTDGYIGNETQILSEVRSTVGDARLYALGVGSSVNRYLIENLALEGRGRVLYLQPGEAPAPAIARFYDQVRSPVMTRISIDWAGLDVVDAFPARTPDLFAGHPLLVTARFLTPGNATVRVTGFIGGERITLPVAVTLPGHEAANPAIRSLWARQAIEDRMRRMLQREDATLVKEVVDLSVTHRVLSQYTAFVAVEQKTRTNEQGDPVKVEVPVEMPKDVSFEGVYGDEDESEAQKTGLASVVSRRPSRQMMRVPEASAAPAAAPMVHAGALRSFGMAAGLGVRGSGTGGGGYGRAGEKKAESSETRAADQAAPRNVATRQVRAHQVRAIQGIAATAIKSFEDKVLRAIRLCAPPAGSTVVLKVAADGKGRLAVVAIEGLDGSPATRDQMLKALKAARLWDAALATRAAGTAQIILTF